MATSALDTQLKIWDIRTYKQLQAYRMIRPASSIDISQRGLLAAGCGPHVQVPFTGKPIKYLLRLHLKTGIVCPPLVNFGTTKNSEYTSSIVFKVFSFDVHDGLSSNCPVVVQKTVVTQGKPDKNTVVLVELQGPVVQS